MSIPISSPCYTFSGQDLQLLPFYNFFRNPDLIARFIPVSAEINTIDVW
ncbi:MAG: hypothetical protein JRI94_20095 [Deltaproteobacteria bacterium]|nr:hypothetical protein [Deltaproteobacteria bacterium]